jgi:hypothetical protein
VPTAPLLEMLGVSTRKATRVIVPPTVRPDHTPARSTARRSNPVVLGPRRPFRCLTWRSSTSGHAEERASTGICCRGGYRLGIESAPGYRSSGELWPALVLNSTIDNSLVGCAAANTVGIVPGADVLGIVLIEGSLKERV